MTLFDPKEDTLKVLCWYIYYMCAKNGGPSYGYLEDIEGSWQLAALDYAAWKARLDFTPLGVYLCKLGPIFKVALKER